MPKKKATRTRTKKEAEAEDQKPSEQTPQYPPVCDYCGEKLEPWQCELCPACRRMLSQPTPRE